MTSDPRVYFAAERTLLAWVRTGIAVVGLGFVVARFGLFLRMLGPGAAAAPPALAPTALGVILVLAGAGCMFGALLQQRAFVATLPPHDLPARYRRGFGPAIAGTLAAVSVVLAGYLLADAAA